MKLKNILIVVDNIEESIHFYNELFGLNVISRQEGNVIMSEGLVLQDAGIWKESMQIQTIPYNNMTELYFEDNDIEGVVKKLESGRYEVRYATALTELDGGRITAVLTADAQLDVGAGGAALFGGHLDQSTHRDF